MKSFGTQLEKPMSKVHNILPQMPPFVGTLGNVQELWLVLCLDITPFGGQGTICSVGNHKRQVWYLLYYLSAS